MEKSCSTVAIIILNYISYNLTIKAVENILNQNFKYLHIFVIDNHSPNESYDILTRFAEKINEKINKNNPTITVFLSEKNGGYSYGNNVGLREAYQQGYRYALILNNDVTIEDIDFISYFSHRMDIDEDVSMMGPMIVNNGVKSEVLFKSRPKASHFIHENIFFFLRVFGSRIVRNKENFPLFESKVYALSGCCLFIRLVDIHNLAYFDHEVFLFGEELILGEKVHNSFKRAIYFPQKIVYHDHASTIKQFFTNKQSTIIMDKSIKYYLKTYRSDITPLVKQMIYITIFIKEMIYFPIIDLILSIKKKLSH